MINACGNHCDVMKTELNVFAIQTIFANVNTCIENTKFSVGMKSIFRYVHDLDAVSD